MRRVYMIMDSTRVLNNVKENKIETDEMTDEEIYAQFTGAKGMALASMEGAQFIFNKQTKN